VILTGFPAARRFHGWGDEAPHRGSGPPGAHPNPAQQRQRVQQRGKTGPETLQRAGVQCHHLRSHNDPPWHTHPGIFAQRTIET